MINIFLKVGSGSQWKISIRVLYLPLVIIALFLGSCKTYYIPLDSFKQQFAGMNEGSLKNVIVEGPLGGRSKYKTYPIAVIKCIDKKGNPFELENKPSIEIRFTHNNKRTVFYFDRMYVTDTSVTGLESRILEVKKTILLNTVTKIEVQDGKKKYSYVQ